MFLPLAGYNHLDVVEYLLEHNADVNAKDKGGLIPLHNASSFGVSTPSLPTQPLRVTDRYTSLTHWLLYLQHVDVAAMLIKHNSLVNATDRWNFTPLHEAAQKGRTQLCSLLILHGADVNMSNQEGEIPCDLATVSSTQPYFVFGEVAVC